MLAISFTDHTNNIYPDTSKYISSFSVMYISLSIAAAVCLLLLTVTFYAVHRQQLHEKKKHQTLLVQAIVVNTSHTQILSTLNGQLPSLTIEKEYLGVGVFDHHNLDFLR